MNNLLIGVVIGGIGTFAIMKYLGVKVFERQEQVLNTVIDMSKEVMPDANPQKISQISKIILLISGIYMLSPIDIIPDAIPFIGNIEDLLFIFCSVSRYSKEKYKI